MSEKVDRANALDELLAAAEERGRRRGEAERGRLRRALLKIRAGTEKSGFDWGEVARIAAAALAPRDLVEWARQGELDDGRVEASRPTGKPIAPRDSAPVCGACDGAGCDAGGAWCRICKGSGRLAPRDSRKGFSNADEPFADLVAVKGRKMTPPDSDAREVNQEPRGARFTILPDSEEADRDFIILDVPPSQAQALHEKVAQVLAVSTDSAVTPDTLIGVYLEVEPHPCMNIGRNGEEVFPRPPSLLCGEGVHLDLDLAQRILAALEVEATIAAAHGWLDRVALLTALAAELRERIGQKP